MNLSRVKYLRHFSGLGLGGRGVPVAVEGPAHGDGLVGSDRVVDRPVGGDLVGEFGAAGDVPAGTFLAVSVGDEHVCGLRGDATISCWGDNDHGQTDAPGGTFTAISAGEDHSCALGGDATISCWGNNEYGQTDAPSGTFTAVAASLASSYALRTNGTVTGWGDVAIDLRGNNN